MQKQSAHHPMRPADYDVHVIATVKAMVAGVATESQQKRFMEWIIQDVARVHDLSMFTGPDGERLTSFAEGRRFVGLQVIKMLNPETLKALDAREAPTTKRGKR